MCPPDFFAVPYAINPWMDPSRPVDVSRACGQWQAVKAAYQRLGHQVVELAPLPGQPDMVFAANGMAVVGGRALRSRFRYAQRAGEQLAYDRWLRQHRVPAEPAHALLEGEGDLAVTAGFVLLGYGPRSELAAAEQVRAVLAAPTRRTLVTLELVDPAFYHLDTCLGVLDDRTAVYVPSAFTGAGRAQLAEVFTELIELTPADAAVLGANVVSDGQHVLLEAAAADLAVTLVERGFTPIRLDTSELRKSGGSVKCVTQELRGLPG